jgi:MerR family transcriptional regulator, light-induced transcriptional regulator
LYHVRVTSVVNRSTPGQTPAPDEHQPPVGVRIGELSRRVGVSAELLRAWERRYQVLRPARSLKGYRLYSTQDEQRIRVMQDQLARGLSAAEAARVARRPGSGDDAYLVAPPDDDPDAAKRHYHALRKALDAYDDSGAQQVVDQMLRELSLITVLRAVVMPYLAELGARWEQGTIDVAQEHFASNLLRGRLAGLALGWGHGVGPRAVLAGPEGELHDLSLMVFGIALNRCGWRVTFLGNNTPVRDLDSAVRHLKPAVVVLAATSSSYFDEAADELRDLAKRVPLVLAGAGATPAVVAATGSTALPGDPVTEALGLRVPAPPLAAGAGS